MFVIVGYKRGDGDRWADGTYAVFLDPATESPFLDEESAREAANNYLGEDQWMTFVVEIEPLPVTL